MSDFYELKLAKDFPPEQRTLFLSEFARLKKNKTTAFLLALILGNIGAHQYYLGNLWLGTIYTLFCWTLVPGIIGLIELFFISGRVDNYNMRQGEAITRKIRVLFNDSTSSAEPSNITQQVYKNEKTKKAIRNILSGIGLFFGFFILLGVIGGLSGTNTEVVNNSHQASKEIVGHHPGKRFKWGPISMEDFSQIRAGMSYEQVVEIIGAEGKVLSESEMAGIKTVAYSWQNPGGSNALIMFQNNHMVQKAQSGLN